MSEKPQILVARRLPEAVEARLAEAYRAQLNPDDRVYGSDELIDLARGKDAIVACHTEKLTAKVIARLPENLRIVANYSVGVDHVDLAAAKTRGLVVTNTPEVLSDATAEIAVLLILGAARRASEGERMIRAGRWRDWSPSFMVGKQVTGSTLGIIGMGRVGQVTARKARGLGMEILYHNRHRLPAELEEGAAFYESLDDLLPHCQFLSLHCPATPETRGLLNAARIAQLPDRAIVVNTARGALVDDEALIAALKTGKVAAAGLDVFNNEPNVHPGYLELENTFLLPHIGSATHETRDAMGFRVLANLEAFFAGREPRDRVA